MSKPEIVLRGLRGPIHEKRWQSTHRLRVGRVKHFEIVLEDVAVSRQHAEIIRRPQGWCVHDLESTNGTYLNGVRVGRAEMKLRDGDILQFGELNIVVESIALAGNSGVSPIAEDLPFEIQHAVSHRWEDLPKLLKQVADSGRIPHLQAVVNIGRDFFNHNTFEKYLRAVLWDIVPLVDCQLAAISLVDEVTDQLALRTVFNQGVSSNHDIWSVAEAEFVRTQNESIICRRASGPETHGSEMFVLIRSARKMLGVLQLVRGRKQEAFTASDLTFVEALCFSIAGTIESVERHWKANQNIALSTLTALTQLTHLRDDWTGSQTKRATDYALILAEQLKLSDHARQCLQAGTPLRDLGRLSLPDHILNKPGPLTREENYLVKMHVSRGVELLESIPTLVPIVPIVRSHHERWDGTGYPDQLKGEQIPMVARVVAVADALDALTTSRPYRAARTVEEAFWEIRSAAGSQFDPRCVEVLFECREQIEALFDQREQLTDTIMAGDLNKTLVVRCQPA